MADKGAFSTDTANLRAAYERGEAEARMALARCLRRAGAFLGRVGALLEAGGDAVDPGGAAPWMTGQRPAVVPTEPRSPLVLDGADVQPGSEGGWSRADHAYAAPDAIRGCACVVCYQRRAGHDSPPPAAATHLCGCEICSHRRADGGPA